MNDIALSKNFDLSEFVNSDTARKRGIDNTPPEEVVSNLRMLVTKLLQPLRDLYGKPMHINSGYRCKKLNEAVGGMESSQHKLGQAADVKCDNPKALYALLKSSSLSFDQCGIYSTFLHLSYKPQGTGNRRMTFHGKY